MAVATVRNYNFDSNVYNRAADMCRSVGLDEELISLMRLTGGYIAGGAALSLATGHPLAIDQDIDIWVPTPAMPENDPDAEFKQGKYEYPSANMFYDYGEVVLQLYDEYFKRRLFKSCPNFISRQGGFETYEGCFRDSVRRIWNYTHPTTGFKIQVIYTWDLLPHTVVSGFDMTATKLYYAPKQRADRIQNVLNGRQLTALMAGVCYYTGLSDSEERKNVRVAKYKARGFSVVTEE